MAVEKAVRKTAKAKGVEIPVLVAPPQKKVLTGEQIVQMLAFVGENGFKEMNEGVVLAIKGKFGEETFAALLNMTLLDIIGAFTLGDIFQMLTVIETAKKAGKVV
jgi:hypothetical protein